MTLGEELSGPFFQVIGQFIRVNSEDTQLFEFADFTRWQFDGYDDKYLEGSSTLLVHQQTHCAVWQYK